MKANAHIYDVLHDPDYGPSYAPEKSAFSKVHGTTLFKFYIENVRPRSVLAHLCRG